MCGFVGVIHNKNNFEKKIIKEMNDCIEHRGPDSEGMYVDENIALGFKRLSIVGLSEKGNQPMICQNNNLVLTFNGEIYNYISLKIELEALGHTFITNTDSEVLIHGFESYGIGILNKLRGMFAFSMWDKKFKKMYIARDYFGIKPLYYTKVEEDNSILFGSEIKSLLKYPYFKKELNKSALKPFLMFQYSALDESFFKGVYKLKPAHYLVIENQEIKEVNYWKFKFNEIKNTMKSNINRINEEITESAKLHTLGDVEVGTFLSGGIDSSYITTLIKPDKTFSVGFKGYESMFDETDLAKELSDKLGIKHYKKIIHADDFFEKLPEIQYHMDEPHANLSAVPLYFLSEMASKHVKVVLSGEGADELFGGYDWYKKSKYLKTYEKLPLKFRKYISKKLENTSKNRITTFLRKGGETVEESFIGQASVFSSLDANDILSSSYKSSVESKDITKKIYSEIKNKDDLTKQQYLDINLWLPGDILQKADKMSMAHSLELRVPFLDRKVADLAKGLPSSHRMNGLKSKYVLREAASKVLPRAWAQRPKVGFPVPIRHWLKEEKYYNLVKEIFNEKFVSDIFDVDKISIYLEEHYNGSKNRARYIYTIYIFLIWYKEYFIKE